LQRYLVAHAQMVAEIRGFGTLADRSAAEQALLDLLHIVETKSQENSDPGPWVKELVEAYKAWKYASQKFELP
jgi:hypothetical protein